MLEQIKKTKMIFVTLSLMLVTMLGCKEPEKPLEAEILDKGISPHDYKLPKRKMKAGKVRFAAKEVTLAEARKYLQGLLTDRNRGLKSKRWHAGKENKWRNTRYRGHFVEHKNGFLVKVKHELVSDQAEDLYFANKADGQVFHFYVDAIEKKKTEDE
jgi:hypothetical protein